ncbi:MAG: deoxyribodipyrimidine photo-lyase [Plesiomonas sp.]
MARPPHHLVWLRADLRLTDNRALHAACADPNAHVSLLFIAAPQQWQQHDMAPRQAEFIRQNLCVLAEEAATRNLGFLYREVPDFSAIPQTLQQLINERGITHLYANRQYELNEQRRDEQVSQRVAHQVSVTWCDDALLTVPGTVCTAQGQMYKVYTPFRRALLSQLLQRDTDCVPAPSTRTPWPHGRPADVVMPFSYPCQENPLFPAGENAALQRLRTFCQQQVAHYHEQRDCPALPATSLLSAYLTCGVLSVRQCLNRLQLEHPQCYLQPDSGAFSWLNELIWREFYHHLLAAFPDLCRGRPFIPWTEHIPWSGDQQHLLAWQTGQTGYPIVDAAMRQLNQTGWMHNRLRMICAGFLVKDLLLNWRWGERYFMRQLVDGSLAANNGGWQWSASTGTDAAPYFRIFNPTTQGQRFDPKGLFIRQWLPELAAVPERWLHTPHEWAAKQGVVLNYPYPLVEHAGARKQTLAAYEMARRIMCDAAH